MPWNMFSTAATDAASVSGPEVDEESMKKVHEEVNKLATICRNATKYGMKQTESIVTELMARAYEYCVFLRSVQHDPRNGPSLEKAMKAMKTLLVLKKECCGVETTEKNTQPMTA